MSFKKVLKNFFLTPKGQGSAWKIICQIVLVVTIAVGFVFAFSNYVPFSMDEFIQYHALSCLYYPLNKANTFREACHVHDLAIFSECYWPLRSFDYVGSAPGLIYFPLFKVWPSPYSARFLGLLFLMVQALCLRRLFKINFFVSFFGLLIFMPYAFQHVVDTGVAAIQLTSVFLVCCLTRAWMMALKESRMSWLYPLWIGLVLFFCFWIKVAYLFMLPGIFVLMLYEVYVHRSALLSKGNKRFFLAQGVLLASVAGGLGWMLFNASSRWGIKYGYVIRQSPRIAWTNMEEAFRNFTENIAPYFMDPMRAAHYIFEMPESRGWTIWGILFVAVVVLLVVAGLVKRILKKEPVGGIVAGVSAFVLTIFIMSFSPKVWAMHHVVLSLPFLLFGIFHSIGKYKIDNHTFLHGRIEDVSRSKMKGELSCVFAKCGRDKLILLLAVVFLVVNVKLYSGLPYLPHKEMNHHSNVRLNAYLNKRFNGPYVFVVLNWGLYYIKALYGHKDQSVVYVDPLQNQDEIDRLKKILRDTQRKAVFVLRSDAGKSLFLLRDTFPHLAQVKIDFDTGKWLVWCER
ncbi:MAG: hypothetical protein KAJ18_04280 [Candidatus Omnitrophica bacterium]|nr:hypothetical protein [Candidatus Omnitrophota bacterium]